MRSAELDFLRGNGIAQAEFHFLNAGPCTCRKDSEFHVRPDRHESPVFAMNRSAHEFKLGGELGRLGRIECGCKGRDIIEGSVWTKVP